MTSTTDYEHMDDLELVDALAERVRRARSTLIEIRDLLLKAAGDD